ncbi:MAG: nuclear transport factor 2 family protein [Caulobacteraceae bacterium]
MSASLRAWFDGYVDAFNRSDFEGFGAYYADDVEFIGQAAELHGRKAILDFYRTVKSRMTEVLAVRQFVGVHDRIGVEIETRLQALVDWPDFPTGPLVAGQKIGSLSFVFYDIRDGRFARIRSAGYQRLAGEWLS